MWLSHGARATAKPSVPVIWRTMSDSKPASHVFVGIRSLVSTNQVTRQVSLESISCNTTRPGSATSMYHQVKAGPYGSPQRRIPVRHSPVRQVAHQFRGRALIVWNQREPLLPFNQPHAVAYSVLNPKTLESGVVVGCWLTYRGGVPVDDGFGPPCHLDQDRGAKSMTGMVRCRLRSGGQLVDSVCGHFVHPLPLLADANDASGGNAFMRDLARIKKASVGDQGGAGLPI